VFSFIAAEKTNYPVAVMCRVFGVNRTGFHNWERRAPSNRALQDAWLTEKIKQIHAASRGVYGAPRIHAELRLEHGIRVGRKRVARLMKAAGIAGVRPRKRWKTTIRVPGVEPGTDLVERQFRPTSPNVVWVADITFLRTGEGWLYLAAVQDAYSRQIVGWSMAPHMRSTLVVDALKMALARRRPGPGLIHHSDQGSQYVSLAFGRAARQAGIAVSMGSRGDAYDNAVAETFFATLKKELVNRRSWPSRLELQSAVFEYIEAFYNRRRRHSTLGMVSPAEYEQTQTMETSIKIKQPTT
jgi:putative transposase